MHLQFKVDGEPTDVKNIIAFVDQMISSPNKDENKGINIMMGKQDILVIKKEEWEACGLTADQAARFAGLINVRLHENIFPLYQGITDFALELMKSNNPKLEDL